MRTSQITLALAVALILSVTGCQDRPGGFAVTDPSADPAFESDGFQRMVEVIGPTWPWPGFVERHGQPPADPSTPWLIPRFDDTGRDVWAVPGFGPWSWKQIEITSRGNWTGQYAWLTIGSDGFAQTLTEFSGRVYTGDDFERLGFSTGFALIHSYHLRAAERELASIRARGPVDADPAVEIKVLEERIGMLHKSLDVWRATELGLLEADDQGDDDDWCDVRPRISSADTRQTVDKATGDDSHARISASGDHSTDEKAIHSLGTIIQVRNRDRAPHQIKMLAAQHDTTLQALGVEAWHLLLERYGGRAGSG